ncbi:MFS transporter [Pseudovibrio japonicus]|uniref:MFS transporter n=1 Tax=Pseudovibrio japonicus TaxID=366534 RepID=A0ABQ3DUP5_9HYPH|nr:MFS transporter [Pseudovibrio japonicus]GHB17030.1 MFS transporter [Pseudovibrio japonicus]
MTPNSLHLKGRARGRPLAVAALFLAAFMNLLDVTIVNLALPVIQSELRATPTQLEWVLVIYVLAFGAGLLPFGRFGDAFGRMKLFSWGIIFFISSSLICGLAQNVETLIAARGFQGVTAAMMVPQVLAIVHVLFEPEERGKIIGIFATVNGFGAVAGPILGGAIVSADLADLSWRPIFLINLPLGLLSLLGALVFLPKMPPAHKQSPDWIGACTFVSIILGITYPLVEGRALGWPVWCFALIAVSGILAVFFVGSQLKRAQKNLLQLIPASLLRDKAFLSGLVVISLFFSGVSGVMFILAIFLQWGHGFSPLDAGLASAFHPVGVMIASSLTVRLGARFLAPRLAAGAGLLLIGMTSLQLVILMSSGPFSVLDFIAPLLLIGVGMGTAISAMFQSVLLRVSGPDAGAGSGILQTFQQLGIAIGITIVGQIFFSALGQASDPETFNSAASHALLYSIGVYLLLTLIHLASLLKSKKMSTA